ncbi:uncharacterized protein LOC143151582 isoform X2 [Ptiloglossa arizonensis]|uniref:uncharacterized protein LOC143151582 isoform X2 n=1 Tax=Ptiloglossa arizonensis TaxID=3350558 RepID=UPI003FA079A2
MIRLTRRFTRKFHFLWTLDRLSELERSKATPGYINLHTQRAASFHFASTSNRRSNPRS